jgi:hypothetical protein
MNKLSALGATLMASAIAAGMPLSIASASQKSTPNSIIISQKNPVKSQREGKIRVIYSNSKDPLAREILPIFRKEKFFEMVSAVITANTRLPRDITVFVRDCGTANAFYSNKNRSITVCNELTSALVKSFIAAGMKPEEAGENAVYAVVFIFYHEAGHMLISELNLPITGREEDVADQFSAYILLDWFDTKETAEFGRQVVAAAAQWFAISKTSENNLLAAFLDEHSLNEQRFFSLLCMLYVKDPDQYAGLVSKYGFTPSRLRICRSELNQITKSWNTLLKPYAK